MQLSKGFTPNIQSYVLASEGGMHHEHIKKRLEV